MLKKFVEELTKIDNAEHKKFLMLEAIAFQNCEKGECEKTDVNQDFENALIGLDVPEELPEEQRKNYITDVIDKSMGIETRDTTTEICATNEAAGDFEVGKTLTMKKADYLKLKEVVNNYSTHPERTITDDHRNATKVIKKFIVGVLKNIDQADDEKPTDAFILAAINLCVIKFVPTDKKESLNVDGGVKKVIKAKLKAVAANIK